MGFLVGRGIHHHAVYEGRKISWKAFLVAIDGSISSAAHGLERPDDRCGHGFAYLQDALGEAQLDQLDPVPVGVLYVLDEPTAGVDIEELVNEANRVAG